MALLPEKGMRGLDNIKKEFDQYLGSMPFVGSNSDVMRVDVRETSTNIIAECDLPGIKNKEDIHVDIINNRHLKVSAIIQERKEEAGERHDRKERLIGKIDRSITLPNDVSLEGTIAGYKNGVLKIEMPKTNINKDTHIDVQFD